MFVLFSLIMVTYLLVFSFIVFRVIVRNDYRDKGKLGWFATTLEIVVFALHANLSYLFLPAQWPAWPEMPDLNAWVISGLATGAVGLAVVVQSMAHLGFVNACGQKVDRLHVTGLYRLTRNPQILGYGFLLAGVVIVWFSWLAVLWLFAYVFMAHWMVLTEEEHLKRAYGKPYGDFCEKVPRYLSIKLRERRPVAAGDGIEQEIQA